MSVLTKLRNWLRIIGINAALLLVVVVIFELAFGSWFDDFVAPEPRLLDRTFSFRQTLYEPHGNVTYFRDKYGLRTFKQPVSAVQLVTFGGSTTAQSALSDGETWQDVIHQRTGVVIANAGVDGMGTQYADNILEDWLFRIPELRPKYFLYYVGINDAWKVQTLKIEERKKRYSWNRRIHGRSIILQFWSKLKAVMQGPHVVNHSGVQPIVSSHQMTKAQSDRHANQAFAEQIYKSNMRYLLELHRNRQQTMILVTQVANPAMVRREGDDLFVSQVDFGEWAMTLEVVNEATRSVCREHPGDCHLIDLARDLKLEPSDFYDLVHNTPQGARKVGEYLAEKLTPLVKSLQH